MKNIRHNCLALISGAFLPLAFSPVHEFWLAIICPAILLWLWLDAEPGQAFKLGYFFGLGFFGIGASWVYVSIHTYGGADVSLAAFITLIFIATLSLFPACNGYCLQRFFPQNKLSKFLLAFPATWVLFEIVRSYILSGFPWLLLGHATVPSILAGWAPILGVYGAGFVVCFASGLLLIAAVPKLISQPIMNWKISNIAAVGIIALLGGSIPLASISWTKDEPKTLTAALVQGNIPQSLRWDPAEIDRTLEKYRQLSLPYWPKADVMVWPEAAIPLTPLEAKPYLSKLNQVIAKNHSGLLTGIPISRDKFTYFNGAIGLGRVQGEYTKRHLVPFGEYVPLESLLRGLIGFFNLPMSNMVSGDMTQTLMKVNQTPVAVFICYEVAYSHVVSQDLPRAELLITISDDAWFGNSFAPWQHLQIGQFQAAATGRELLVVGNDGITAYVNNKGAVVTRIPQFQSGVLLASIHEYHGLTPWILFGDYLSIGLMLLALLLAYHWNREDKLHRVN